ncbi:MAG: hypothetical protein N3B01_10330 [Verrucomicrobiae bacterium]|nr:hypothetical protein [Verrucomicrobiae bacterium]
MRKTERRKVNGGGVSRRGFLNVAVRSLSLLAAARALAGERLSAVRQITRGPKFHWRGYYDKLLFDPTDRFVLANQVNFEGRSPSSEDVIRVGMVDTQDGDKWIELGTSRAWNWQQGCMLQWVPGSTGEVAWNDRDGNRFVCHILDVHSGKRRTLPAPFYCLSPDGCWGLAPDFRRLHHARPGYGYAGVPDPNQDVPAPDNAGIWRVDMRTGKQQLILSFADVARIPFTGAPEFRFTAESKHWFNHLLVNTNGTRFFFLHRWTVPPRKGFFTRAFTAKLDGTDLYELIPNGKVSHFVWRDSTHILAYAGHPATNEWKFCVFEDKTRNVTVIGDGILKGDGHISYVPRTRNEWVVNDTYPDKDGFQHVHLFHIPSGRRVELGSFLSPPAYRGEWRCDTHPSCSRGGKLVSIDSPHNGGRQVYLIDIGAIVG